MEKQIIYNIITSDPNLELNREELICFSKEFQDYYKLIQYLRTTNQEVNKDNVELASVIKEVDVDMSFLEKPDKEIDTRKAIDTLVRLKQRSIQATRLRELSLNYQETLDTRELEKLEQEVRKLLKRNDNPSITPISTFKENQINFINRIKNGEDLDGVYLTMKGFKSFFMKLSYKLKLIENTDLIVIAGRPSVGKTSFSLALVNQLQKNKYRGLFFSLEMGNEQLLHRMTVAKSGITNNSLFDIGTPLNDEKYNDYVSALNDLSNMNLYVVDKTPSCWLDMKQIIIDNQHNLDYIIIDYLGLIGSYDGKDYNDSRYNIITKITRDMKLLCREIKKPIILLSQFNRNVGAGSKHDDRYEEAFMRDLRDSGSVEQDADKILILYRKKEKDADREAHERFGTYKVICKIEKNRAGTTGKIEYDFNANLQRWKESEN